MRQNEHDHPSPTHEAKLEVPLFSIEPIEESELDYSSPAGAQKSGEHFLCPPPDDAMLPKTGASELDPLQPMNITELPTDPAGPPTPRAPTLEQRGFPPEALDEPKAPAKDEPAAKTPPQQKAQSVANGRVNVSTHEPVEEPTPPAKGEPAPNTQPKVQANTNDRTSAPTPEPLEEPATMEEALDLLAKKRAMADAAELARVLAAEPLDEPPSSAANGVKSVAKIKALALAGDLAGFFDAIVMNAREGYQAGKIRLLLRFAIKQASKKSPRKFSNELYREAASFLAFVQMRLHTYAVACLAETDNESDRKLALPPDLFVEKILPLVEQLMRLAMDLNQSRAQTDRLWRVARGNGKRAEKKRPRNFDQWYKQLVDDGVLPDKYAS